MAYLSENAKKDLEKIILITVLLGFAVCGLLLLLVGILQCVGGPDPRQGNEALENGLYTLILFFGLSSLLLICKLGIFCENCKPSDFQPRGASSFFLSFFVFSINLLNLIYSFLFFLYTI